MGVAAAKACMQCHTSVKADNPSIQKLAAFAKDNRSIPWERVYQIPTYVSFSHRAHTTAGNTCAECHGQVTQRDQLSAEVDLSMTGCMNCHQQKGASVDCSYRHEPR
jgi:cytochrome c peroxidase